MPVHDPIPPPIERAEGAWVQYKRLMRWMVLVAVGVALLALLYLKAMGSPMPIHMVIATFAGVSLTVLLGAALMGLVFLSANSGHDDKASRGGPQK